MVCAGNGIMAERSGIEARKAHYPDDIAGMENGSGKKVSRSLNILSRTNEAGALLIVLLRAY